MLPKLIYGVDIRGMRKEIFEEGEFYHIYSRGVDGKVLFNNDREKLRFIHSIYILNNFLGIPPHFDMITLKPKELLTPIEPYVEIVAGCIMSTHYHLMLSPKKKGGVSKLMHKVGLSYSHYFNKYYERKGRLFESTFKTKHVDRHEYLFYLTQYIHLNPIDLYLNNYSIKSGTEDILEMIYEYQWSSLPIYLDKQSPFSLLTSTEFRDKVIDTTAIEYKRIIRALYKELYLT